MRFAHVLALSLGGLGMLAACGDGGTDADAGDAGVSDGGRDAALPDGGADGGSDAGRDASADAGPDADTDAAADAGTDMDAAADAGTDMDAAADAAADAGTDMDAAADAAADADTDAAAEPDASTDAGADPDAGTDASACSLVGIWERPGSFGGTFYMWFGSDGAWRYAIDPTFPDSGVIGRASFTTTTTQLMIGGMDPNGMPDECDTLTDVFDMVLSPDCNTLTLTTVVDGCMNGRESGVAQVWTRMP